MLPALRQCVLDHGSKTMRRGSPSSLTTLPVDNKPNIERFAVTFIVKEKEKRWGGKRLHDTGQCSGTGGETGLICVGPR